MALQNPNSLYSGGQGILRDNTVDYVTALENKKRAKDEALDKYYSTLPMTVNAKGVRDQEIPILHEAKNRIQQYWMMNRDSIKKGNTPEAYNYGKMFREAQGLVQESKNRAATADKLAKLRGNPKYDYIFRNPQLIEQIDLHERPIGTEGATGINFDQITLPPPPFDQQKYRQGLKDIKPEYDIRYDRNPADSLTNIEVKTPKLNAEQLKRVSQYAASELYNNPSFEDEIKSRVKNDPMLAPTLQKVFQDKFGRPIENDADLATAYTINSLPFPEERKVVPNALAKKNYDFELWKKKNGITFGQRKELAQQQHEYQKAMKYGYDNQWLDQNWENLKANPTGTLVVTRADGNKEEFKVLGVSNVYKKFFESQGYEPDDVIIDPKGNVSGVIYQRDEKDGKIIKSEATGNRPIVQSVIPVKMSEKQAKIYYGKSISSGKDLTGEIGTPDEQKILSESTNEKSKTSKWDKYKKN